MRLSGWEKYPKTPRLSRCRMVITEKIDGTNGCIVIYEGGSVSAYSRKRLLSPAYVHTDTEGREYIKGKADDNYGFAAWVHENEAILAQCLPVGVHYGEWAGPGIQKNPLGLTFRQFFLFSGYPCEERSYQRELAIIGVAPVPILYIGDFSEEKIKEVHNREKTSSVGGAHNYAPEGIIINAFGKRFKRTEGDLPKGETDE